MLQLPWIPSLSALFLFTLIPQSFHLILKTLHIGQFDQVDERSTKRSIFFQSTKNKTLQNMYKRSKNYIKFQQAFLSKNECYFLFELPRAIGLGQLLQNFTVVSEKVLGYERR